MNVRIVYTSLLLALLYLLLLGSTISPAVSASPISPSEKGKGKKLEQPTEPVSCGGGGGEMVNETVNLVLSVRFHLF